MFWRYSSIVVAPIICILPRASAGLSKFAPSIAPSAAAPEPTMVWISSMNRIMSPLCFTSSRMDLNLSSNSPRYFVPATTAARSSETTRFPDILGGTFPSTMSCAKASATAVFPTPGSPIRHGLFFIRRTSICIALSTSFVRPTTGSSSPLRAIAVRSTEHFSNVGTCTASPAPTVARSDLPALSNSPFNFSNSTPRASSAWVLASCSRSIPNTMSSVPIWGRPISFDCTDARWNTRFTPSEKGTSVVVLFFSDVAAEFPPPTFLNGFQTPPPPPVFATFADAAAFVRILGLRFSSMSTYFSFVTPKSSFNTLVAPPESSFIIAIKSSCVLTSSISSFRTSSCALMTARTASSLNRSKTFTATCR
mmetsp:Transcript_39390/g.63088  ORF Transcript_39390/g.63088 Transcript_39390/m.63088 type:complete len:365 (-) Transcript_39390:226-1320(-)